MCARAHAARSTGWWHSVPDLHRIAILDDARRLAELALAEDGPRDISSLVSVSTKQLGSAVIEFRAPMVVAGLDYADAIVAACGLEGVAWQAAEGDHRKGGTVLGEINGNLRAILRAERPLLNLLQRACGVATLTSAYVSAVAGMKCRVLHTRKTTPGLRRLEIEAVVAGGGMRHRADLTDDVMIKDNHWKAIGQQGITLALALAEARVLGAKSLQVEVESLEQLEEACAAGATRILIDNQTPAVAREWCARAKAALPAIEIEATGGITLDNIAAYAAAGVDYISLGVLTHSVPSADLGLEVMGSHTA